MTKIRWWESPCCLFLVFALVLPVHANPMTPDVWATWSAITYMQRQTYYLLALVTACSIEVPLLFGLVRFGFKDRDKSATRIIMAGILCTALTLPYLWFVIAPLVVAADVPFIGELFVVVVEALLLFKVLGMRAYASAVSSIVMNMASFFLGLFLMPYFRDLIIVRV